MNKHEMKFYDALEDIFLGAKIEGDGGFVNLLSIKSAYYKKIIKDFKESVSNNELINSFKEEFFDRLYSFFEKYFSESGSVYFTKTRYSQNIYEQVYTDTKDVVLFWKTNVLYYVKSDLLFQSTDVTIEEKNKEYSFFFDCTEIENKQNNEKKELIFTFDSTTKSKHKFTVTYSVKGRINKIDELSKVSGVPANILEKAFNVFKKQNKVDFFINKDAKKFLTNQLDLYLNQILLEENNQFDQVRLDQIKTVKEYSLKIIDFISQFENELVKIWNKPKFVMNSNYVISFDRLPSGIIDKLMKHPGWESQVNEWNEFQIDLDSQYKPIDTKHFKNLEMEILSIFNNIDDELDGRLIRSENYQALNTLSRKYKNTVQTIYIDPPFNTGKDFAYIDNYQDSTWLSLMNDRLIKSFGLLKEDGSFWLHLDHNANNYGKEIIKNHFNDITEIIFDTNATKDEEADLFGYKSFGSNFQLKHQTIFYCRHENNFKYNKLWKPNRNTTKLNIGWLDLTAKPLVENPKKISDNYYHINKWDNGKLVEKKINIDNEKLFPVGDIWNDIFSFTQSEMRVSESLSFTSSQKPENLLRRIIETSTDQRDLVIDYFLGIGTTIAVAQKLNRKWIGIEMGSHIEEWYMDNDTKKVGVLGRMKLVLNGDQQIPLLNRRPHLSKDINWQGGGFFKYYDLEQYEDTLRKSKYNHGATTIFDETNPFANYIFQSDDKLADVLEVSLNGSGAESIINIDFDKLYANIDFPETISLIKGKAIKKISPTGVLLEGERKEICTDYKNMDAYEKVEFVKMLKPLLWWGD